MSRGKHSEAQIIASLRQVEAGRTAEDVARECGVSKHTIYARKAKLGGMEAMRSAEAAIAGRGERTAQAVGGGPEPGTAR
jgi:DNA-binding phage protein